MDLKQMQYFLCLAQEGNATRAARRLNIVQPALSMQIAKLETALNKQLFFRSAQGMSLTAAGEEFERLVAPIIKDIDRAREEMARLDGKVAGRVGIGMINSAAQSVLPVSTLRIAEAYPDVELCICEGYSETMLEWVLAGQLDLAVVNARQRGGAPPVQHILDEEMMLAHSASAGRTWPKAVSLATVKKLDLVLPSRRHGLRRILDQAAADAGFALSPRLEMDTLPAICGVVASTGMATILPGIALRAALEAGTIRAHRLRPALTRSIAWVSHPRRVMSSAMQAAMEIISDDLRTAAEAASRLGRR
ncbi:MAG: LysR family transcriptional regulator [Bradyrhizobium sp.]|nr:LysR family transcriptional regulator [Bradyrhizobium sp.]